MQAATHRSSILEYTLTDKAKVRRFLDHASNKINLVRLDFSDTITLTSCSIETRSMEQDVSKMFKQMHRNIRTDKGIAEVVVGHVHCHVVVRHPVTSNSNNLLNGLVILEYLAKYKNLVSNSLLNHVAISIKLLSNTSARVYFHARIRLPIALPHVSDIVPALPEIILHDCNYLLLPEIERERCYCTSTCCSLLLPEIEQCKTRIN
jgi:hypothetical protein